MNIKIMTSPQAVSFNEVARVIKQCMIEYNYNCDIGDVALPYIPSISLNPMKFNTWDLAIIVHTFQKSMIERALLYSSKMYSEKLYFYSVVEGKPILPSYYRPVPIEIITPSKFCKEHIESVGYKVKKIIPHGIIHREYERPKETEIIKDIFGDRKILLYIGNGDPRKAIPRLIEALSILKKKRRDWVCLMHTDERIRRYGIMGGREAPPIDKLIEEKRLQYHIWFTKDTLGKTFGEADRKMIAALYHSCDLHIMPSYCEGFGIPLIEAGACHKTSICIDAPPMNEIVNDKCSYLVPYEYIEWTQDYPIMHYQRHIWNPETMAEIIDYALSNPQDREEKEQKNHENSLKYDYKKTYTEFLKP
jgi:glycosyltransferase involved in cell wall biosynthesis